MKKYPNYILGLIEYGSYLFTNEKYNKGLDILKKSIQLNPNICSAYYLIGFILIKLKKQNEGIMYLHKSVELDPLNIYARINLGQILMSDILNNLNEAEKHIMVAYNLDSNNVIVISQYIKLLIKKVNNWIKSNNDHDIVKLDRERTEILKKAGMSYLLYNLYD